MAKLTMYRGDARSYSATVTTAFDSAAEVHFAVKDPSVVDAIDATDSNALFTVDATSANAVDNGDGTVTYTFDITKELTTGKAPGKYKAEIEYVDGDGNPTTYDPIDFVLKADINQRS